MSIQTMTLGEISEVMRTGKTPPTENANYFNGAINWYTPGDLDISKELSSSKRTISQLAIDDKKASPFPENSLLISCIGELGKIGIARDVSASNQQITAIKPKSFINVDYLYYWFKANKKLLELNGNNAVVPIINNGSLKQIPISFPPLAEQIYIAQVLDQADRLRQQDRQLLAHYTQLVQAVFMSMFGDPVRNDKGWEALPLIELIAPSDRINYGVIQPGLDYDDGIPVVRVGDIRNMQVNTENLKRIDPLIEAEYKRSRLVGDEILLGCVGSIGVIAIVDKRLIGFNIVRATARIRCNPEKLNRIYLAYFMATPFVQSYFAECTRAVANPTLNIKQIAETTILLPPIELQNQFAEAVAKIEVQKTTTLQLQAQSEALFNSLLQQAFRGELKQPQQGAGHTKGQLALALE